MVRVRQFCFAILILFFMTGEGFLQHGQAHAASGNGMTSVEVIGQQGAVLQSPKSVAIGSSTTALDALKSAVGSSEVTLNNGMIMGIKGLASPKDWSAYWAFYINGVSAPIGAGSYTPANQDVLLFEYHPTTPLSDEVAVTIPDKSYGTTSLYVKVTGQETVLSVLEKMASLYNVTIKNQSLSSIGSFTKDQAHQWVITDKHQKNIQQIQNLSQAVVQGGDQLTVALKEAAPAAASQTTATPQQPAVVDSKQLSHAIDLTTQYVAQHGVSEWEAIALSKAGKPIPASYLSGVAKKVKDAKGNFHAITDTERYTLGILAAGGDPTTISGYNLVSNIYNGDVKKQGLNGVIFGLITLESTNFKIPSDATWTPSKLVSDLLTSQNADGGWSWDGSKTSDLDTTGMAMTALSTQTNTPKVKEALQKAENYISSQFQQGKVDNSSTASQLIVGLTSNGISPESQAYTLQDGTTLLSHLLSFQQKDGGFDWKSKDESAFSTQQAFLALVADQLFKNHKGSLYTFAWHHVAKNQTGSSSAKTGASLPNTATPYYNLLMIGGGLVLIGVFLERKYRKKRAS